MGDGQAFGVRRLDAAFLCGRLTPAAKECAGKGITKRRQAAALQRLDATYDARLMDANLIVRAGPMNGIYSNRNFFLIDSRYTIANCDRRMIR